MSLCQSSDSSFDSVFQLISFLDLRISKFQFKTHYRPGTRLVLTGVMWTQTFSGPQRSGEADKETRGCLRKQGECYQRGPNGGSRRTDEQVPSDVGRGNS